MKITARYKRLNTWNKVGFWGAVAGILGIIITVAIFLIVQCFGPTKANQEVIKKDVAQIVEMLREELGMKDEQIMFLQDEVTRLRDIVPSDRARHLAQKIPEDAGPYALALKAIAEKRFDDARQLLDKAQEEKEIELAEIYRTRGQLELYAGNYKEAADWCEKSLELAPDNIEISRWAGRVFHYNAKYDKAEKLLRRALEINEASFGPNDPNITSDLDNLAQLLQDTNRLAEAELLYRRALVIGEQSLDQDNHKV
jgi:tetratricopeptide (TPR) repeat protein